MRTATVRELSTWKREWESRIRVRVQSRACVHRLSRPAFHSAGLLSLPRAPKSGTFLHHRFKRALGHQLNHLLLWNTPDPLVRSPLLLLILHPFFHLRLQTERGETPPSLILLKRSCFDQGNGTLHSRNRPPIEPIRSAPSSVAPSLPRPVASVAPVVLSLLSSGPPASI